MCRCQLSPKLQSLTLKAGSQTTAQGGSEGTSNGGTVLAIADKSKGTALFEKGATIDVSGGLTGGHAGFTEVSGSRVKLGGHFRGAGRPDQLALARVIVAERHHAGGGGAVLALALAQKGIKTIVLEQAPGPPQGLRGEILQPNGQQVLDRLGVLQSLPSEATRAVRKFHFCRAGGVRLCSIDYGDLPAPYNRAIVTLPNVAHHAIVDAVNRQPGVSLRYGTSFSGLLKDGDRVVGVRTQGPDGMNTIGAKLVVGADGAFSKVRDALKIPAEMHLYREGYLVAIVDSQEPVAESFYYVGHKQILGLFPAARTRRSSNEASRRCYRSGRGSRRSSPRCFKGSPIGTRPRFCRRGASGRRPGSPMARR